MPSYVERFPVGTRVQVLDRGSLELFQRTWRYHHPLGADQLVYAGCEARVADVSFYHGGDVLYKLDGGVPGIWHEQLLVEISSQAT